MPSVTTVGQAIKIAKQTINDAGYYVAQITTVDFDEKEGNWDVDAVSGTIEIHLEISADDGEVIDFSTEE